MNIFLQALNGYKTVQIGCELDRTVEYVKATFEEKEGVAPDRLILIFAGKRLEDKQSLSDCGIVEDAILKFVIR